MRWSQRGAAMLAALLFLVVASGIITLMFTSTLSEIRHSGDDIAIVQALTLARGGANMGGQVLRVALGEKLSELTVSTGNTVSKWAFGDNPSLLASEPLADSVIKDLEPLMKQLQVEADLLCNVDILNDASTSQTVTIAVFVTDRACGRPLPVGIKLPTARFVSGQVRTYSVPYVLVSEARVGGYERNVVLQGEYQFKIGGEKFSQYALFTDEHVGADANESEIWFTSNTLFDGPVHTNGHFRFAFQPWFGGDVTSAGCYETDSNNTECIREEPGGYVFDRPDRLNNQIENLTGTHKPVFAKGMDWRANYIPLPQDGLQQREKADGNGLLFPHDLYELELFAGDNTGAKDNSGNAEFQYIRACIAENNCEIYRYGADKVLYKSPGNDVWPGTAVESEFNGLIYSDGVIERLTGPQRDSAGNEFIGDTSPALASFATITVVSEGDIQITGDLTYETPPCTGSPQRESDNTVTPASCDNIDVRNILGVFTPTGDIIIGTQIGRSAPENVVLQGSFMAAAGAVTVEGYNSVTPRGEVNLLGGIIEKKYGAFGKFNENTGDPIYGYGRRFIFDQRMALGYSPPFFPGTDPSIVQSVFVYGYGQREQVDWY